MSYDVNCGNREIKPSKLSRFTNIISSGTNDFNITYEYDNIYLENYTYPYNNLYIFLLK